MGAKRFGGVPPIVTVLIAISAVVAAGLVAWFLFATTSSAVKTPILEVTGAYAVGTTLRFTVRNVGGATASSLALRAATCTTGGSLTLGTCNPSTLNPGQSSVCTITGTGNFADGTSCIVELERSGGRETLSFKVAVP